MKEELISVVVAVYNSSDTVIDTLNSIKNQTYKNMELVVTDDCSTDDTMKEVARWIEKNRDYFKNVRLITVEENQGITRNFARGVKFARGKYVQYMAGDDLLREGALEKKYEYAISNKLDVVICKIEPFGRNLSRVENMKQICDNSFYHLCTDTSKDILRNNMSQNKIIGPMCSFFRKSYWEKIGGFNVKYPMIEDWPFINNVIKSGEKIIPLDEILCDYRVSGTSISTSTANKKFILSSRKIMVHNIFDIVKYGWWKDIDTAILKILETYL